MCLIWRGADNCRSILGTVQESHVQESHVQESLVAEGGGDCTTGPAVASVCCHAVGSQVAVAHGPVLAMLKQYLGRNSTY